MEQELWRTTQLLQSFSGSVQLSVFYSAFAVLPEVPVPVHVLVHEPALADQIVLEVEFVDVEDDADVVVVLVAVVAAVAVAVVVLVVVAQTEDVWRPHDSPALAAEACW